VIMGYQPIVSKNIAPQRAFPVVTLMYLSKNPRAYGRIPIEDKRRDQKYSPWYFLKVNRIIATSSTLLYIARPAKKTMMIFSDTEFPS